MQQSELDEYQTAGSHTCPVCGDGFDEHGHMLSHRTQAHKDNPWQDEDLLRKLYVDEGLSSYQIADGWECNHAVVSEWINRFEIKRSEPWKDAEVLKRLYIEQEKSQREVGEVLGCEQATVGNWLRKHDIEIRGHGDRYTPDELADKSKLRELYIERELSVRDIGEKIGENGELVWWWLHRHGIETRGSAGTRTIEKLRNREFVHDLYVEQDLTSDQISERYGWSATAILTWVDRHGIETRRRGARVGEKNAAWKGGHKKYRLGAWKKHRKMAKARDGYRCQWCGVSEEAHKETDGMGLDVHHIVPYRTFDDPFEANRLENLLTVCRRCHKAIEGRSGGKK